MYYFLLSSSLCSPLNYLHLSAIRAVDRRLFLLLLRSLKVAAAGREDNSAPLGPPNDHDDGKDNPHEPQDQEHPVRKVEDHPHEALVRPKDEHEEGGDLGQLAHRRVRVKVAVVLLPVAVGVRLGAERRVAREEGEELEREAERAEDEVPHAKDKGDGPRPLVLNAEVLEHKDAGPECANARQCAPKKIDNKYKKENIIQWEVLKKSKE